MRKEWLLILFIPVFMTVLVWVPVGYFVYRHWLPRIVTVDLHTLVEEHQQCLLKAFQTEGAVTETQRATAAQHTADFAKRLSSAVEALSQTCHCMVINQAALLGGMAPDYTDWVRERIQP